MQVEQTSSAGIEAVLKTSNRFQQVQTCVPGSTQLAALSDVKEEKEEKDRAQEKNQGLEQTHMVRLDGHLRHACVHINNDG